MSKETIAIIGQGHVGTAFKRFVENHYDVVAYDPKDDKTYPKELIDQASFAVICVPTPESQDGSCDTSIVEESISKIGNHKILIKSTVSPGTTDRLSKKFNKKLCFSPEYIGESTYNNPIYGSMADTPFVIVGGPNEQTKFFFEKLEPILGPLGIYYGCSAIEAELIKYMENSFFATKITFVNEFYEIVKKYGADWYSVREGWLLDQRVGRMHTSVFADKRGFAGKCLPKDTAGIIAAAESTGYSPDLLKQVVKSNNEFTKKNKNSS